jgi:sulfide:quinone oxidoreductase
MLGRTATGVEALAESGRETIKGRSRVLVAGGGIAALEAVLALRELAAEHVFVELLAPEPHFWLRPLAVAEPFGLAHAERLELSRFARDCGAEPILGALVSVDAERRVARTTSGAELDFDVLLLACGARPVAVVPGALTFRGPADVPAFRELLAEVGSTVRALVFAIPPGITWTLPLYELALLTASHAVKRGLEVEITVVTHERTPLDLFGEPAGCAAAALLEARGIGLRAGVQEPAESWIADRVVAMPRLEGVPIGGIPADDHGFVSVDPFGRIEGLEDCYAAGDITASPVKQGGLAAQQADAAASAIAAAAGADVEPEEFRPDLRGLLLTGAIPRYLHADPAEFEGSWPPSKVAGRHLAPYLASLRGELLASSG